MAEIVIKLVNGELAGKTMQGISKELNAAAMAVKKAEVGTQAWVDANAKLEKAKGLQSDLKKQIDSTTKASDTLKGSFMGILNQVPGFQQASSAIGGMKGGVGGLTSGFGLLRGAIIATGLGALVVAVVALVSWFTKTEKGANMISGAFKAVGAVVDTLLSKLYNIGDTLKQFLINPIAFFKNLGKDIASAAGEAYDLVQIFDELEDRQRALNVADSETEKTVARLLGQSKNVAKSYEERLALIEQADKVERESFNNRTKYLQDYLKTVEQEVAAAEKNNTMGDDLADKLAAAQIELNKRATEQIEFEEKLANRRELILEKQDKANEKSLEERRKAGELLSKELQEQLEKEVAARKNIEDLKIQIMEDGIQKEIAQIELETEQKLEALTGSAEQIKEQKLLLMQAEQLAIAGLIDKYAAEQAQKDVQNKEDQAKRDKDAADKKIAEEQRISEEIFQGQQLLLQATADTFAAFADLLGQDEKNRKRHAGIIKALQAASVTTSLVAEIQAIWEYANKNPMNAWFPGAGQVIAIVKTVAATARATAAISKINTTKFEEGGLLRGPRHSQGGIPIEAEGGEFIFSRRAVQGIGVGALTQMNNHFTKRFASGGPVNPFQDRGSGRSGSSSSAQGSPFNTEGILHELKNLRAEVAAWPTRLKAYVVAREVNDMIKMEAKIKNDADL